MYKPAEPSSRLEIEEIWEVTLPNEDKPLRIDTETEGLVPLSAVGDCPLSAVGAFIAVHSHIPWLRAVGFGEGGHTQDGEAAGAEEVREEAAGPLFTVWLGGGLGDHTRD